MYLFNYSLCWKICCLIAIAVSNVRTSIQISSQLCLVYVRGTGISGLTRGLATLPPRWIQDPSVVRGKDGRPQEDPLAVHCFCVCSGSVLLGDLLGVSRSTERDLLSVLFIYPRFFVYVQYVSSHSLSLFYSAII